MLRKQKHHFRSISAHVRGTRKCFSASRRIGFLLIPCPALEEQEPCYRWLYQGPSSSNTSLVLFLPQSWICMGGEGGRWNRMNGVGGGSVCETHRIGDIGFKPGSCGTLVQSRAPWKFQDIPMSTLARNGESTKSPEPAKATTPKFDRFWYISIGFPIRR